MTDTAAVASIRSLGEGMHLTGQQLRDLRVLVTESLRIHRDRATQAAEALDDFTSSDSPHEREIVRNLLQSQIEAVGEHEDALGRLDDGTYGVCYVCARPIAFERLEAIPEVSHCVGCVPVG